MTVAYRHTFERYGSLDAESTPGEGWLEHFISTLIKAHHTHCCFLVVGHTTCHEERREDINSEVDDAINIVLSDSQEKKRKRHQAPV